MLRTLVWQGYHRGAGDHPGANSRFRELEDPAQISDSLAAGDQLIWVDLTDPTPDEFKLIAEEFELHPLAVEDAAKQKQRPKIEEYANFYFMVAFAIDLPGHGGGEAGDQGRDRGGSEGGAAAARYRIEEIDLFIGERFLVTVHRLPVSLLETMLERWRRNSRAIDEGIGVLVYTLLDGIVDAYFPVLDQIVERVEHLEEALFTGVVNQGRTSDMRRLFQVKRDLLQLRRVIAPQRDSLLVLARQEINLFDRKVAVYFQDVYDHVVRVTDTIDSYQDLLANALDSYLSLVNNNLNQVLKTLTALTVMLVVPTLIAGIYGMNFEHMPELAWRYGYPFALGLMALSTLSFFLYFRRKGWL